ncbi:hypothetical protein EV2_039053 [Malus domestica]
MSKISPGSFAFAGLTRPPPVAKTSTGLTFDQRWACLQGLVLFVVGISVGDDFLANEHTAPLGDWRRLRAAVGLLLSCRALSGKSRRARLVGQDSSGKALRARLKENENVKFEKCLCEALGVGLEAHNQG